MALKKMDSVLDLACRCLLEIQERCILQFRKYELDYERSKRPLMSHLKKHQMFGGPNFLCLVHIFLQPHLFSILLREKELRMVTLIVRSKRLSWIQASDCQVCNQCLKGHKSPGRCCRNVVVFLFVYGTKESFLSLLGFQIFQASH